MRLRVYVMRLAVCFCPLSALYEQFMSCTQPTLPTQALYEQFRRAANIYFLCISILSFTPISPVAGVTNTAPLALVVAVLPPARGARPPLSYSCRRA